ncbi:MAG: cysteine desulfurase-like protein, partial [Bacteroidota bacterium]
PILCKWVGFRLDFRADGGHIPRVSAAAHGRREIQNEESTMNTPPEGCEKIERARADFPSLNRMHDGRRLAYLDGPAGTQVPQQVLDAIVHYYMNSNANTHGQFVTANETDLLLEETREKVATFLGTTEGGTVSFGANMTTLAYSLSRALARKLVPGDEVLITQLDHEANRGPWLDLSNHGIQVKEIAIKPDATLDEEDFRAEINDRTRLVAMGLASNAFGTVNDVMLARELTARVGAWLLVDAVHYAPHFPIDVEVMGVDFLLCSAYKFYGPHVGILYAREGLLDQLQTDCLRTQAQTAPHKIETGTLNHASLAGVKAAIEYIASLGSGNGLRLQIVTAMESIAAYEHEIARGLYDGLGEIDGVTRYGPSFDVPLRAPTVSFTVDGRSAVEVCRALGEEGICVWDGHFYAIRPVEILGLLERGGVTRVGISLYNRGEEVARLLSTVARLSEG